jgi:hypothetical protein
MISGPPNLPGTEDLPVGRTLSMVGEVRGAAADREDWGFVGVAGN